MNVVFDFGAVLFTWRPVDLVTECFPERAPTPAQAGHLAHEVFGHADWQGFDRGAVTMPEVIDRTVARLGLDRAALTKLVESIGERLVPMPESMALLNRLDALRTQQQASGGEPLNLYFLSNMPVPYARTLEHLHPFLLNFDGGIFSGDVLLIKPEAAQAQGWHGIHFKSAQQVTQDLQAWGLNKIGL